MDSLVAAPAARVVRVGMLVGGAQVGGLLGFSVTNNNFFTCDTWSATIGLQAAPSGYGAAFWSIQTGIEVQLMASLTPGSALVPVIGGVVDSVSISLDEQTMTIEGRDYSAPLIDATTNEKFLNQTASQVATTLAKRRGLVPQVTATKTLVGRYINNETAYVSDDISEFRLLSLLAQQEGFDVYAVGKTLFFGPPVMDANPLVLNYSFSDPATARAAMNAPRITLHQHKNLAGPVTAQVRSWNYQNAAPIISTWQSQKTGAQASPASPSGNSGTGPFYIVRESGLTQMQADNLAKKTLSDITNNEREIRVSDLPAVLAIDTRRTLRLSGTGTAFDQDYVVSEVTRTFSWADGATMGISAKAPSPQALVKI